MKIKRNTVLSIGTVLLCSIFLNAAHAEIKMPKIFSDNMLLQRDAPVNVWGKSAANAKIEVRMSSGFTARASADALGNWKATLPAMKASKTPLSMTVAENGNVQKSISNILVGEVWILGGQSNMEFKVMSTTGFEAAKQRAKKYANTIRNFHQNGSAIAETPQFDSPKGANWSECNPETVGNISGVGFYFAEALARDLDVPVGLVYTPLGATSMNAWIPVEAVEELPFFKLRWNLFLKRKASYDFDAAVRKFHAKQAEHKAACAKAKAEGKPEPKLGWPHFVFPNKMAAGYVWEAPVYSYNAKVAPVTGYSARGFLWYQGEGDCGIDSRKVFAQQYKILVESWLKAWRNPNMKFYCVQLTSYNEGNTSLVWAETRLEQLKGARSLKNGGIINTIDLGERNDIHPRDKTPVGLRLERLALADTYGAKNIADAYAPEMENATFAADTVKIKFKNVGGKLEIRGAPRGFDVLSNGRWTSDVDVSIENGDTLVLKTKDGSAISAARNLWKNWAAPDVCLFSTSGLPAFAFNAKKSD